MAGRTVSGIEIPRLPWNVPNFVLLQGPVGRRQDGPQQGMTLPLASVQAEVLAEMCDEFRAEIFRKAGKVDPATAGGRA